MSTERKATSVVTGLIQLGYVYVQHPKSFEGGDPKYQAVIMVDKKDKITVQAILKARKAAMEEGITKKWAGKKPNQISNFKDPVKDGDKDLSMPEEFRGKYFFNATAKERPAIIDRNKKPITDFTKVYSGVFAFVSVNFYPFNVQSKGVAVGLNNIMIAKDGPRFAGGASAEQDFAEVDLSAYGISADVEDDIDLDLDDDFSLDDDLVL